MCQLNIAISTISNRIESLNLIQYDGIQYVIVHQEPHQASAGIVKSLIDRPDVIYVPLEKKGLSVSRNTALVNATGDYVLIMDDDVTFSISSIEQLLEQAEREHVDVATYYHRYSDGTTTLRKGNSFIHNKFNISSPSSIDICIKRSAIIGCNIKFDENFGLGAIYPSGEEMIFLSDCLKNNLLVKRYPIEICTHPPVASGLDFYTSLDKTVAKYAMLKRIFPVAGQYIFILFVIKKMPQAFKANKLIHFIKNSFISFMKN